MILNIKSPMVKVKNLSKVMIDTNVLIDVFYSNISKEISLRERIYQNFVNECITNKKELYTTEYNIFEAFHLIDKINLDIYCECNEKQITMKEYHKIEEERVKVHQQLKIFYNSVKKALEIIPYSLNDTEINKYIIATDNTYDLYDFALLKAIEENNFKYLLTHDSDFCSNIEYVSNIYILTQNDKMINNRTEES